MIPIQAVPGICKSISEYASGKPQSYQGGRSAQGRYTDGDHTRFVAGFPEKIGGWSRFPDIAAMTGVPRVERTWRGAAGTPYLGIGTDSHLYQFDGSTLTDISPLRTISVGTLGANPLTTTNGSATVAVADSTQKLADGDWVKLTGATVFNNVTILGWYRITGRSGTGYNVTASTVASASSAGGGAAVLFSYPRVTLGAAPFATTSGSATVTVTHALHGAQNGDWVTISGAAAVAGLTLSGEYQIANVATNTYTVTASGTASSTTTGGGSAVSVIYVITVNTFTTSSPVAFGTGVFGTGTFGYGTFAISTGYGGWTLDRYGSLLLAAPIRGTIYVYDPALGGRAHELLNAPTSVLAMFVTPERFVVALGTSSSSLTMAWADQNDFTVWTSTPTNTALTGRTKQGGTAFVAGAGVRGGVSLSLTDRAAFQMNYTGGNFIYDTPEVTDNAGCVSPWAIAVLGESAFWMSDSEFWTWDGAVRSLPSDDIRDYVFKNINKLYSKKCWTGVNRAKKEVWFSYPSGSSTEIDRYVIYHIDQQCWSIGSWTGLSGSGARSAWCDADLFPFPVGADVNGYLYQHEFGTDDNGVALNAYINLAPADVSNGDMNMDVFGFIPDFTRRVGDLTLTVTTRNYPQDAMSADYAYTIEDGASTPELDFRADGKMVGFNITSNAVNGDFRFGTPRVIAQASGARL